MTPLSALRLLLNHIDRTSIQGDPEHLLVAISRQDVDRAWSVVHAGDKSADRIAALESQLAESEKARERLREALEFIVQRFGPSKSDFIFSQRHALDKAMAALAAEKEQK